MMSPCRGCPDRSAECHGGCALYREYREKCDRRMEERRMASACTEARRAAFERTQTPWIMKRKREGK